MVAGVLIALSADRWVQALDDDARRRTQLGWIASDLQADSATLTAAIERERLRVAQTAYLLDTVAALESPIPDDELARVVWVFSRVAWSTPANYSNSTWSEMVAAGELSLLGDPELRRDLSSYYLGHRVIRESEDDREQHFQELERAVNRIRPVTSAEFAAAYRAGLLATEGYRVLDVTRAEADAIRSALRSDPDLRGLVTYAGSAGEVRVRIYGAQLVGIAALLDRVRDAGD